MKTVEIKHTVYPRFPDIMDHDLLAQVTAFDREEQRFISQSTSDRQRYLKALYLKAMRYLGHSRFFPKNLPRLIRIKIAEATHVPKEFVNLLTLSSVEKSRIVVAVRAYLQVKPYAREARKQAEADLQKGVAREENDLSVLINETIRWFAEAAMELPKFKIVAAIAQKALNAANRDLQQQIAKALTPEQAAQIAKLVAPANDRTPLDRFKDECRKPSTVTMQAELDRLQDLQSYYFEIPALQPIARCKIEYFARIGQRYTAAELDQLHQARCITALYCYLQVRRPQLLDKAAESFIQIWRGIKAQSKNHADVYQECKRSLQEQHDSVLEDILGFICDSPTDHDLIGRIRKYRTPDEYARLREEVKEGISWSECYYRKLKDHYTSLRRFLPQWYATIPMVSTTADNALLKGVEFIVQHGDPRGSTLTAANPSDIPVAFLSKGWQRRTMVKHPWNGKVQMVHKAPYELALVETIADALKDGRIAIEGARRYAPITQHLIPREKFLSNYASYLKRLNLPENAWEYYQPLLDTRDGHLRTFDDQYNNVSRTFRVNRDGSLSYLRSPHPKPTRRTTRITKVLQSYITRANILEVLLDCDQLAGYLDIFQPLSSRQNMDEESRILKILATLYAYGCNCGPTQASQATGVSKQAITYFRRRYMENHKLMEASSALVDAYSQTSLSRHLQEPGIFMTDAMHFPTLKDSLTARHYFRDFSKKNVLLYQHVTPDSVCFFTKALLCGVSEAIHMLDGAVLQTSGYDAAINICDNAGKSDFVFGIASLLNMEIWPRLNSRQKLKLWGVAKDRTYNHIGHAITGVIQPEHIDSGWQDAVWVLASIAEGKAEPSLIAEHLNKKTKHPATKAFNELGKILRTSYMIRYGLEMPLRYTVQRHTARREHWNQFGRNIFHGFGGLLREKDQESQEEIFWFLTVVQNAIALWNALALDQAVTDARQDGVDITDEDLKHVLPTMIEHINFVGQFLLDFNRQLPFKKAVAA